MQLSYFFNKYRRAIGLALAAAGGVVAGQLAIVDAAVGVISALVGAP